MSYVVISSDTAFTDTPEAYGPFETEGEADDYAAFMNGPGQSNEWTYAQLREPEYSA